jgi:hypothetical protein
MRVSVSQKPGGDPTESLSKRMGMARMGRIRIKQQQGMALCVVVEHARSLRVCAHTHHRRARALLGLGAGLLAKGIGGSLVWWWMQWWPLGARSKNRGLLDLTILLSRLHQLMSLQLQGRRNETVE